LLANSQAQPSSLLLSGDILGHMTTKVRPGNRRVTGKEQFYTPADLAKDLTAKLIELLGPLDGKTVLEPAGGTGSFVQAAKEAGASKVISFDIEPKADGVLRADFLDAQLNYLANAITISNPPFGRNNSLSIPFFNKAAKHSDVIAFIVPRSWRKWSVLNRLDLNFHLIHDEDLAIDYVDEKGASVWQKARLKTCFQVWQRRDRLREIVKIADFGLVSKSKPEDADVAITVFGYGCGKVRTNFEPIPNSTVMFLKLHDERVLPALTKVDFSRFYRNTAYTEALSLQEIRYLLNEEILGDPGLVRTKAR
jgi:predicted RNA methylase